MLEDYYDFLGEEESDKFVLELSALACPVQFRALNIERPLWKYIDEGLERVYAHGGFVRIRVLKPENSYIDELTMDALPEKFRIIVLTRDEDRKRGLLEWWEPGDVPFRGIMRFTHDDEWDTRTISNDLSIAKAVFWDLFEDGEISPENMENFRSGWDPKPR